MSGARSREIAMHDRRRRAARPFAAPARTACRRAVWMVLVLGIMSAGSCAGPPPGWGASLGPPRPPRQQPSEPARRVAHVGIGRVQAVAFSPVGGRLAVATTSALELWNTETWEREAVLAGDDGKPFPRSLSLSFSGDGAVLAVGSSGPPMGNIALWSMTSLTVVATLNDSPRRRGGVTGVSLSADGSVLAAYTYYGMVELWDIQSMALLRVVNGGPGPDGSLLARAGLISLSPDGSLLALAGPGDVARVWDVATGVKVAVIDGHTGDGATVMSVAFSPDGTMLATVHAWEREFYVALWDVPSHRKVGTLVDEGHHIRTLAFSSDGALLATAGDDEVVRVWDVGSSRLVARLKGHRRGINSLSFSPDGSMLASGGGGVVLVWDVATGRLRTAPAIGPAVTPSPR